MRARGGEDVAEAGGSRSSEAPLLRGTPISSPPRSSRRPARRWSETHGPPLGVGAWLACITATGFALPLPRADASDELRAFVLASFALSALALVLVNRLDPGVIPPTAEDDPLILRLDAAHAESAAAESGGSAAAAGATPAAREGGSDPSFPSSDPSLADAGVRRDPRTNQWARLPPAETPRRSGLGGTRYGAGRPDDDADPETAAGVSVSSPRAWDWSEAERYCRACRVWRPPRAAHCRECGWCVRRFDHHCGALGNCVGRDNHRWFVLFLCVVSALVLTLLFASVDALGREGWPADPSAWRDPAVVALVLCGFAYGVMSFLSLFAASHVCIFLCDVTTKEIMRPKYAERGEGASGGEEEGFIDDAGGGGGAFGFGFGGVGRPGRRRGPGEARRRLARLAEKARGAPRACAGVVDALCCARCRLKSVVERRMDARAGEAMEER
jgi:hypothetical protein